MKKYPKPGQVKICYIDTDAFIYYIKTDDVYKEMMPDLDRYDTSDYQPDNQFNLPLVNKKVIGLFKDENNGKLMKRFVGLRSKLYSHQLDYGEETKKAKGIKKNVVAKLRFSDYQNCLYDNSIIYRSMNVFKSIKHQIFTRTIKENALNCNDDKRFINENNINTLAWGHYKITND